MFWQGFLSDGFLFFAIAFLTAGCSSSDSEADDADEERVLSDGFFIFLPYLFLQPTLHLQTQSQMMLGKKAFFLMVFSPSLP